MILALVLAVAAATDDGAASTTQTPSPREEAKYPLAEAEAALRAGIHKKCVELAQAALATGRLDVDSVARAWLVRGRCHAIDGDPDRAERSYAVAVRVNPAIVLPTDDAIFAKVKPEGSAPETALLLSAHTVVIDVKDDRGAAAALVAIAVTAQDDLGLARAFVLLDDDDREVARAPIERAPDAVGDAFVRPAHRFSGIPVEGLRTALLDRHGNFLRIVPVVVDDAARAALRAAGATPTTASATSSTTWLSLAGAGAATVGLVGAAAGGILFTTAAQADPTGEVDDELPAFAGFLTGVGLVVVGGALMVADQLPR